MLVSRLITRPCTLTLNSQAATEPDDYGNEVPVDPPALETVCELQQQQRKEPPGEGELSDTVWALYLLPGTEIRTGDVVTVDDLAYEMVGDPWHVRHPRTGEATHLEATVRRTA